MTLIADLGNYFLNSDRSWGRRERRLMDTILVRYKELYDNYHHLPQLVDPKKLSSSPESLTSLRKTKDQLNQELNRMGEDLRELFKLEFQEFERDLREPFLAFKEIIIVLETYLTYLKKEGTFVPERDAKLQQLFEKLKRTYDQIDTLLSQEISRVQETYERELKKPGSAYPRRMSINELASVGDQWERDKIALSQKIRELLQHLHHFKEELNKHLTSHKEKLFPQTDVSKLVNEQMEVVEGVLKTIRPTHILSPTDLQKAERELTKAIQLEQQIQEKFGQIQLLEKLAQALPGLNSEDKANFAFTKFRATKGKSGEYPLAFWLGSQRALGYLKKNDTKNLDMLGALLKDGLLAKDAEGQGMLYERKVALDLLWKRSLLFHSSPSDVGDYLDQYTKNFEDLTQHISQRSELAVKIFGLIGLALYDLELIILDSRNLIEKGLEQAQVLEKGKPGETKETATLKVVKKEEEQAAARELDELTEVREEGVKDAVVLQQELKKARRRGGKFFSGLQKKVAMILLPLMAAGAISAATSLRGSPSYSHSLPKIEESIKISGGEESEEARLEALTRMAEQLHNSKMDSLKKKISAGNSPVDILYEATNEEMLALYESGRGTIIWAMKGFGVTQLGDATKEVYRLQKKINSGTKLEEREVRFLRNYYYLLAIGGKVNGMEQASEFLVHYLEGSGADLSIEADIYEDSAAVKIAQERMLKYIRAHAREGETGRLRSSEVFKAQESFRGSDNKYGGIVRGDSGDPEMYILAEQDNSTLKNANNRFILIADYALKGGMIQVTWRVEDDYSFNAKRDLITKLMIPGTSQELVLSDVLSAQLVKYGAKPFMHHAQWTSVEKVRS